MAERIMLRLGGFDFEIGTAAYQKFSLSQSWRWPEQARIARDSALQFTGSGNAVINLDGVIYASRAGGVGEVETLRGMAGTGKPFMLVDGLGFVWGCWVILEVGDTRSFFMDDGQARKIEFRLKLRGYGEDA